LSSFRNSTTVFANLRMAHSLTVVPLIELPGETVHPRPRVVAQEPLLAAAVFSATLLNTLDALLPRVVMAAMQTTTMSASITAYSPAVGPSSSLRNRTPLASHLFIDPCPFCFRAASARTQPWPTSSASEEQGNSFTGEWDQIGNGPVVCR